ncbi:MAG: hypothetical protein Q7K98_07910 [Candidatus Omnitrophota bacterium]|nr:hypothetical protein [Candidatus Omnitrophota bacterium]
MRIKEIFLITFILFLPLSMILAEGLDEKAQLRYQAMEQEMDKLAARRDKAMEEAIRPKISKDMAARDNSMDETMAKLTQKKSKERFFFTQKPSLWLLSLKQNPIMPR